MSLTEDGQALLDARARVVAEITVARFAAAAAHPVAGERLARAGTIVHLHLMEDVGVTLLLDRSPIEAHPRITGEAQVTVWCTPTAWTSCLAGDRPLAMAIAYGEADYRGPVRLLLSVLPILRGVDGAAPSRTSPDPANPAL